MRRETPRGQDYKQPFDLSSETTRKSDIGTEAQYDRHWRDAAGRSEYYERLELIVSFDQ
jgi:hypothetical protein